MWLKELGIFTAALLADGSWLVILSSALAFMMVPSLKISSWSELELNCAISHLDLAFLPAVFDSCSFCWNLLYIGRCQIMFFVLNFFHNYNGF